MSGVVNLINPPSTDLLDPKAFPHLGLLYIGAVLKKNGYDCRYIDMADGIRDVPAADYHLLTATCPTYSDAVKIRKSITSGKVIIGGFQPSLEPKKAFVDFMPASVVVGEAENVIMNVINNLRGGARDFIAHGGVVENLDAIPFPARELVDRDVLRNTSLRSFGKYSGDGALTSMVSSRGCPHACTFCAKLPLNSHFRWRSAANITAEMWELRDKFDITHVKFWDECFTQNRKRMTQLCAALRGEDFHWLAMTRSDAITPEILKDMYDSGCREMQLGIESGSQRVLDAMKKRVKVAQNEDAIRMIKAAGIKVRVLLMEHHPVELPGDSEKTKEFMEATQPDGWTLSEFVPLPGSPDYSHARHYKGTGYYFPKDDSGNSELRNWLKSEVWRKK
jgi:anaerobic magnesium-protoporphyrin IX monomethyl ester cyclase